MTASKLLASMLLLGVSVGGVFGQPAGSPKAPSTSALQEDIEIMRRILNRSLTDTYGSSRIASYFRPLVLNSNNPNTYADYARRFLLDVNGYAPSADAMRQTVTAWEQALRPYAPNTVSGDIISSNNNWAELGSYFATGQHPPLTTEGAYLKGHGVVFTLTLPPHEKIEQEPRKDTTIGFCAKCHENLPQKLVINEIYQENEAAKVLAEKIDRTASEKTKAEQSQWEQTRREIRGIKEEPKKETPPPAPVKKQTLCGPSLIADAVLRTLAENGKHFNQLVRDENLSVVITFRPLAGQGVASNDSFWLDLGWPAALRESLGSGVAVVDLDNDGRLDLFVTNTNNGLKSLYRNRGDGKFEDITSQSGINTTQNGQSTATQPPPANTPPTKSDPDDAKKAVDKAIEFLKRSQPADARDYELLGDLHMKQGRFEEAIKAYEKAVQENPASVALRSKHLEALKSHVDATQKQLEADKPKLEEMRKQLIDAAQEYANALGGKKKEAPQSPASPAPQPVPTKLTISVPKRLLDQVGQGTISFEDFKKSPGVTVEYYQPSSPAEKK